MPSRCDTLIREIHALATLRHLEATPGEIGVHVRPLRADCYPEGVKPPGSAPTPPGEELAEKCHWEAQVRLGGGKWSHHSVGIGPTPEEALESLHRGFVGIHQAIDERRAALASRIGVKSVASVDGRYAAVFYRLTDAANALPEDVSRVMWCPETQTYEPEPAD